VRQRLGVPQDVWQHLLGDDQEPAPSPPWWQRMTPLMRDCYLALEVLHCTLGEYYQRTTPRERLLFSLYLAYKAEQERFTRHRNEQLAETQALIDQQLAALQAAAPRP
jgi:hypothetical protein